MTFAILIVLLVSVLVTVVVAVVLLLLSAGIVALVQLVIQQIDLALALYALNLFDFALEAHDLFDGLGRVQIGQRCVARGAVLAARHVDRLDRLFGLHLEAKTKKRQRKSSSKDKSK